MKVVADALAGFLAVRGDRLALLAEHRVVYRRDIARVRGEQVTLISGGGSGHEVRFFCVSLCRYGDAISGNMDAELIKKFGSPRRSGSWAPAC